MRQSSSAIHCFGCSSTTIVFSDNEHFTQINNLLDYLCSTRYSCTLKLPQLRISQYTSLELKFHSQTRDRLNVERRTDSPVQRRSGPVKRRPYPVRFRTGHRSHASRCDVTTNNTSRARATPAVRANRPPRRAKSCGGARVFINWRFVTVWSFIPIERAATASRADPGFRVLLVNQREDVVMAFQVRYVTG